MEKRVTGVDTLWTGAAVAITATNGSTTRFSNANGFTADFTSANTWHRIELNGANEVRLVWSGSIGNIGTQTAVTASEIRGICVGLLNGDPTDIHPLVALGTVVSGGLKKYGVGLGLLGRNASAGTASFLSVGIPDISLDYTAALIQNGLFPALSTGVTPVNGNVTTWEIDVFDPSCVMTYSPWSAGTPMPVSLEIGAYKTIWVSLYHTLAQTDSTTPTANITGTLRAIKYKYLYPPMG